MTGNRMTGSPGMVSVALVIGSLLATPVLAAAPQPGFPSPDDAVTALVGAVQKHDPAAIEVILGPGSEALVRSGDPVKDREEQQRFLEKYARHHTLVAAANGQMLLHIGADDWSLPIPLVQQNGSWRFDSRAGAQEIVNRRIGRNEIAAIRFCLAYVDAQKEYFNLFKNNAGTGLYAQRLVSTPGNYDGLYWPSAAGTPESPLAPIVESAVEEGYPGQVEAGKPVAYQGYYYRVLTAQGPDAPGGARSYLRGGKMVAGFGLVAWPAIYDASGIMTFVVNQDGTVFQKDLGQDTTMRARAIKAYDPGWDWTRVDIAGR
jgi:hypothetical protein